MQGKNIILSNFSRAFHRESWCLRPDHEKQLAKYRKEHPTERLLARGAGLSYNDSCLHDKGIIINTERLNHFIQWDNHSGVVVCQAHTTFKDLLSLDPEWMPPVIPGTVHATVAGGIAHDVHGKNNPLAGSFGHHVLWFELLIQDQKILCSKVENSDLFYATIAGLGLTGIITRVGLKLTKSHKWVHVHNKHFTSLNSLLKCMTHSTAEYQVAWLNLLQSEPCAIVSTATQSPLSNPPDLKHKKTYWIPYLPFSVIQSWNMKLFNKIYASQKKQEQVMTLEDFNNPLDKITHWNRLYGPKGLVQFQAVLEKEETLPLLEDMIQLIRMHKATPTLAVLKYFTQSGLGLLSFCKPGFTLAIDFLHNDHAINALKALNQLVTEHQGRVYLAKDWFLNPEQYQKMYPYQDKFAHVLARYGCNMQSDLAKRLGIVL